MWRNAPCVPPHHHAQANYIYTLSTHHTKHPLKYIYDSWATGTPYEQTTKTTPPLGTMFTGRLIAAWWMVQRGRNLVQNVWNATFGLPRDSISTCLGVIGPSSAHENGRGAPFFGACLQCNIIASHVSAEGRVRKEWVNVPCKKSTCVFFIACAYYLPPFAVVAAGIGAPCRVDGIATHDCTNRGSRCK